MWFYCGVGSSDKIEALENAEDGILKRVKLISRCFTFRLNHDAYLPEGCVVVRRLDAETSLLPALLLYSPAPLLRSFSSATNSLRKSSMRRIGGTISMLLIIWLPGHGKTGNSGLLRVPLR